MTEQHISANLPHLLDLAREAEERMEGVDVNVFDDFVMMSPVSPAHFRTQHAMIDRLSAALGPGQTVIGEIEFSHPSWDRRLSPDLVLWDGDEEESAPYDADAIELAVEIVSASSVENDYIVKPRAYAAAGIISYLVLDPYTRAWTVMTSPGLNGYQMRASGPYGKSVELPLHDRSWTLDSTGLPTARSSQLRDAWPTHRTDPQGAS
jgi:Uma2 family endonuclease